MIKKGASQLALKNPSVSAGDTNDMGWIPRSERYPGVGSGNPSSILAWKSLWSEKPRGIQSMESQRL